MKRCASAIKFGTTLATRCHLDAGHGDLHEGRGLAEFPYQRISWLAGHRREFTTDRDDEHAWEQPDELRLDSLGVIPHRRPGRGVTDDRSDPRLTRGVDDSPVDQAEVYLVLSEDDRGKGFVRPYRDAYQHLECGAVTTMARPIAETYARDPKFYGGTYCTNCRKHRPLSEFVWLDGHQVGT